VVFVDDLSRLARDNLLILLLLRELRFGGVRVISVADGRDSDDPEAIIGIHVRGVFNELQLQDLSKKTLRGQMGQKARGFTVEGESFKRDRFPDADKALKPYLNRKGISFCFYSHELKHTMRKEFLDEVREGLLSLKELYWFILPGAKQGN
jgi:hypothetical protein